MDKTYLDEVDWCLKYKPWPPTKMVPIRDEKGWHLYYEEVPADWPYSAVIVWTPKASDVH